MKSPIPGIAPNSMKELYRLVQVMRQLLSAEHKKKLWLVSIWACLFSLLEMGVTAASVPYVQCLGGTCPAPMLRLASQAGIHVIALFSIALFALVAVKLLMEGTFNWFAGSLHQQVQRDLVVQLLKGYFHMDWQAFRGQHHTHYMHRSTITAVDAAYVSQQCVVLISTALQIIFIAGLMLLQYPTASILLGIGFLIFNFIIYRIVDIPQKHTSAVREQAARRLSLGMSDFFGSFRELRIYGIEDFCLKNLNGPINQIANANKRINFLPSLPRLLIDFFVFGIILVAVTAWLYFDKPIKDLIPYLIFYAIAARAILPAMMKLLSTRSIIFGSIINVELILQELQWARSNKRDSIHIPVQPSDQPSFEIRNVSFAYEPAAPLILDDVSLALPHPSWMAVVGPSGAGKSTLLELMCGISRPQAGQVLHLWPEDSARPRPRIAYLPQQASFLDGTAMDNVVFGFDEGDEERAVQALQLAHLPAGGRALPDGLQTQVGAAGSRLSGGERQRLALARVLYREPDLLLLDEATSGLDAQTEERILHAVRRSRPGMSVLFITHRHGSLRHADAIVQLRDGKLLAMQPPQEP